MTKQKKNATMKKGGKVKNQETEVEIVKLVNNPMDEYASLNEYEKHIVDAVKKNVSGLHDILQMRMFNEKKNGKMVGAHMLIPVVVNGAAFAHELMQLSVELKGIVAVCHDDITDQMAIIISWT